MTSTTSKPLLRIAGLSSGYGRTSVLSDIDVDVYPNEIVVILGPNGAGKTTLLNSISGIAHATAGTISFEGQDLTGKRPETVVRLGITHCPEGRQIFQQLSVEENLIAAYIGRGGKRYEALREEIFTFFPVLKQRRNSMASRMSGGEQQMLAIGRALMGNPRVLLMDEPSEGLAPQIVAEVMATIRKLKESGLSIVLVEQNPKLVFDVADDIVILNTGRVAVVSTPAQIEKDGVDLRQHLGVF